MINADFDGSHVRQRICVDLKARIKALGGTNNAFAALQAASKRTGFVGKDDYVKILMGMELAHDRSDHAQFFHAVQRSLGACDDPGIRYAAFLKYLSSSASPGHVLPGGDVKQQPPPPPQQQPQRRPPTAGARSGGNGQPKLRRQQQQEQQEQKQPGADTSRRLADQVLTRLQLIAELAARMRALSPDASAVERHVGKLLAVASSSSSSSSALRSWRDMQAVLFGFRLRVSDVQVRDVLAYLCTDPAAPLSRPGASVVSTAAGAGGNNHSSSGGGSGSSKNIAGASSSSSPPSSLSSSLSVARLVELVHGGGVAQLQRAIDAATLEFRGEHSQVQQRDANRFADEVTDAERLRAAIHQKVGAWLVVMVAAVMVVMVVVVVVVVVAAAAVAAAAVVVWWRRRRWW
jgi:hypothetical protein